jgi:hypothetical protein
MPEPPELYGQLRNRSIAVTGLILVVLGIVIYLVFGQLAKPSTYKFIPGPRSGTFVLAGNNATSYYSAIQDIGLGFFEIGAIGVVFELINRRAAEQLTESIIRRSGENLGDKISNQIVLAVLGDAKFVREALTDKRRQTLLEEFILANLDSSAKALAHRTAIQLSGARRLWDFRVEYQARDKVSKENPETYARLSQRFVTNVQPSTTFKFHFTVFSNEDIAKFSADPEIFTWRYWLAPGEKAESVLDKFAVEKVVVNNVELIPDAPTNRSENDLWITLSWQTEASNQYSMETVLRLPPPKPGGYVYFEPRALTRGIDISCDYSHSALDVIAVDTLRAENVETYSLPANDPSVKGVRSSDWVLPSASVAFVFADQPRNT